MPQDAIVIDFPTLFHRAFYAAPPLTYKDPKADEPKSTGAILTAFRIIRRLCREYPVPPIFALEGGRRHSDLQEEIVITAEDDIPNQVVSFKKPIKKIQEGERSAVGPTTVREGVEEKKDRREISAEYKANRDNSRPGDFKYQWNAVIDMVRTGNGTIWSVPGYEADDLLASYAKDHDCYLFTNDKDLNAVLRPGVVIVKYGFKDLIEVDVDSFVEEYGFEPKHWATYRALTGDPSDNIKGVPGWGPKKSTSAIINYGGDVERMKNEGYEKHFKVLRSEWACFEESLALVQLRPDILFDEKPEELDLGTMETFLRANYGFTQF